MHNIEYTGGLNTHSGEWQMGLNNLQMSSLERKYFVLSDNEIGSERVEDSYTQY